MSAVVKLPAARPVAGKTADLLAEALERVATAREQADAALSDLGGIAGVIRSGRLPVIGGAR